MAEQQKRQRKPRYVTPAGVAVWPHLNSADDQPINGQPQTPAFKCRLRLDEDDDTPVNVNGKKSDETLKELIDRLVDEAWETETAEMTPKQIKKFEKEYPYEIEEDDDGEPTGHIIFRFKQNETIKVRGEERKVKIGLFDAKRNKVTELVGNGSVLKLRFTTRTYAMAATSKIGITLDFNAAQILELKGFGGGDDADGFDDEDGYSADDEGADDAPDSDDADGDDDEDF